MNNLPLGVTNQDIEDQQGDGLMPCPFCGFEDVGRDALMEPRCDNCGAKGPKDSGAWGQTGEEINFDMDVLWNRREEESARLLGELHRWFMEAAPEHYKGCGLWHDVTAHLGERIMRDLNLSNKQICETAKNAQPTKTHE